jgi:hypothetical protein
VAPITGDSDKVRALTAHVFRVSSHAGFVAFFSLLRAMKRIYPVTVRDENAGRAQHTAVVAQLRQTVWPAWDDDDAMHRDVCRQSERRNQVQRDHGGHCGNCSHIWRRTMLE